MTIRCLTIHARYKCRHSGACCTAGWPIPVEEDRLRTLAAAVDDGRLTASSSVRPLWLQPVGAPTAPVQLQFDERGCVFYDTGGAARCRVHRILGHEALPLACRQFPRVSVVDPRGASVTLSHYCPTAAGLLTEEIAIAVSDEPSAFPAGSEIVGLDVRTSLPPLLTPNMLMDWDAWWHWEHRAVGTLARTELSPGQALATLWRVVEDVRRWTPAEGPLRARIDTAFRHADEHATREQPVSPDLAAALGAALGAVPHELRPRRLEADGPPPATAVRGFLAAHAFANWTAHLGRGLRSWLRSVEAAWVLVNELGVSQADLILRHLADPNELAREWSRAEADSRSNATS